jgi:hypothetical protein
MNKTETGKKYSQILTHFFVGKEVTGESREFLLGLLFQTSRYGLKAQQPGVKLMVRMVEVAQGRRVRMFCLEGDSLTNPGKFSQIPVSKSKVIDEVFPKRVPADKTKLKVSQVRQALRIAVEDQIRDFRRSVKFPCLCMETGKFLKKSDHTHVDHTGIPFVQLVEDWMTLNDLYYTKLPLVGPPTAKRLLDPELTPSWQNYHREFATLALVDASANMSKGASNWKVTQRA